MDHGNIFVGAGFDPAQEQVNGLLTLPGLRIERIVSSGQMSPPDFWYDQPQAEWVLVIEGHARLRFADETSDRQLVRGDYLYIAPHRRHCVEATDNTSPTIWLALHMP